MGKGQALRAKSAAAIDRGRLGAIAVLMFEAVVLLAFLSPAKIQSVTSPRVQFYAAEVHPFNIRFASAKDDSSAKQSFYPYSVIPGGAASASELRNAVAYDSIVRLHYADFSVANARVEQLRTAQAFYVSYRIGESIFWSKDPLTIRAGETVLTDGTHLARTRCGNRLSAIPVAPVSKIEPTPEAMEAVAGGMLLASIEAPEALPIAPAPETTLASAPAIPAPPPIGIFLPLPPFFPVGLGGTPGTPAIPGAPTTPPSGPAPPIIPPTAPPPPVAAPEPSVLLMLVAGFSGIWLMKKFW